MFEEGIPLREKIRDCPFVLLGGKRARGVDKRSFGFEKIVRP